MQIFGEGDLARTLDAQSAKLKAEVAAQDRNYLLNANETQLVRYFVDKYRIEPLHIDYDRAFVSDREEQIPAERFPFDFIAYQGKKYPKQVVTYNIPITGDEQLLRLTPSNRTLWSTEVSVKNGTILYNIINWRDDADEITREWESFRRRLQAQAENVIREVAAYNERLEAEVAQSIRQRKAELLKKSSLLASLGVPVKISTDVPKTFAVPTPKKKVLIAKPTASAAPFAPDPTLDESTYSEILKIIQDTGIEIERHPSIYEGKDEETLRDHLLMVLSPHFTSVTGETFNKKGKTDILIRHEGKNVFVAECGVWKGAKQFLGKIDQLLSYLTWRDSKTALVCFVRNKEFGPVLQAIKETTPSHPCFTKDCGATDEAWLKYEFILKDDPSRPVRLAVMCFHFP